MINQDKANIVYGMRRFFDGWYDAFPHYFYFKGRTNRLGFWSFAFLNNFLFLLLFMLDIYFGLRFRFFIGKLYYDFYLLSSSYLLLTLIPSVSLCIRRLHDANYRGWWVLLLFIPIPFLYINFFSRLLFLIIASLPSTKAGNRFGKQPIDTITI